MSKSKPRQRRSGCGALFTALGAIPQGLVDLLGVIAKAALVLPTVIAQAIVAALQGAGILST